MNTAAVCHLAGITARQADFWTRTGLIPGVDRLISPGSGYPREWSQQEAEFVAALARIVRAGINPRVASKALLDEVAKGTEARDVTAVSLPGGASLMLRPRLSAVSA